MFIIPRTTDYIIPNNQAKIELEILNYQNPNSQLHDLLTHCENSLVQSAFDVLDYTAIDDIRAGDFRKTCTRNFNESSGCPEFPEILKKIFVMS